MTPILNTTAATTTLTTPGGMNRIINFLIHAQLNRITFKITRSFQWWYSIFTACCPELILTSTGLQADIRKANYKNTHKLGVYILQDTLSNGRNVYQHEHNEYYIHWSFFETWSVSFFFFAKRGVYHSLDITKSLET